MNFVIVGIICLFLGIGFRNIIGRFIDKFGEKKIFIFDVVVIFFICFGYVVIENIKIKWFVFVIVYGCYIIDNLMFVIFMVRLIYIKKIIKYFDDLIFIFLIGISMDYVVLMSFLMLFGFLWNKFGYEYVFFLVVVFVLGNLYFVRKIKIES